MGTMIFKRDFKAKFEQLPKTREEVVLKTYELWIFGVVLSTDMGCEFISSQVSPNDVASMDR